MCHYHAVSREYGPPNGGQMVRAVHLALNRQASRGSGAIVVVRKIGNSLKGIFGNV
jgi:hypothetical protein